jgi:hypothetical protein
MKKMRKPSKTSPETRTKRIRKKVHDNKTQNLHLIVELENRAEIRVRMKKSQVVKMKSKTKMITKKIKTLSHRRKKLLKRQGSPNEGYSPNKTRKEEIFDVIFYL